MKFPSFLKGGAAMLENTQKGILYNRWVLYFVVVVTFFNLVTHALHGNLVTPLLFVLVALVTSFFTKNMIIILVMGVGFANLLTYQTRRNPWSDEVGTEGKDKDKEGMTDGGDGADTEGGAEGTEQAPKTSADLDVENPLGKPLPNKKQYKDRKQEFDFIRKKYGELVKIQDELMKNVGSLEGSMANMDHLVSDVKKNLDSIKGSLPSAGASS
jgi:hypothetical protein